MDSKRLSQLAGLTEAINTESVSVNFPQIVGGFEDYHDINAAASVLSRVLNKNIKSIEVTVEEFGFEFDGKYYGIFYLSRKPNKAEIAEMVNVLFKGK